MEETTLKMKSNVTLLMPGRMESLMVLGRLNGGNGGFLSKGPEIPLLIRLVFTQVKNSLGPYGFWLGLGSKKTELTLTANALFLLEFQYFFR
jgi:hypothetical protein